MIIHYELPNEDSVQPWNMKVDATNHDQIALLDYKQDQHIVGISEIREKEALLLRKLRIQWETVDFLEATFEARITSKVDAQNAVTILRIHHGILVCDPASISHLLIKWEYRLAVLPPRGTWPDVKGANEMGADGWELTAVDQGIAYFKRPKA